MNLIISPDQNTITIGDNEYVAAQLSDEAHKDSEIDCAHCAFRNKKFDGEKICTQIPCGPLDRIDETAKFFELVLK